jgi:hypothetical protein
VHDTPRGSVLPGARGGRKALTLVCSLIDLAQRGVERLRRDASPCVWRIPRLDCLDSVAVGVFVGRVADGNTDQPEPCWLARMRDDVHLGAVEPDVEAAILDRDAIELGLLLGHVGERIDETSCVSDAARSAPSIGIARCDLSFMDVVRGIDRDVKFGRQAREEVAN